MSSRRSLDPLSQRYYDRSKEKKETAEEIRERLTQERKVLLKEGLLNQYNIREDSAWVIKLNNGEGYEDIVSLEGNYFDIIEYVMKKWDKMITPTSKIEITTGKPSKKIDMNFIKRLNHLKQRKENLQNELDKINKELEEMES